MASKKPHELDTYRAKRSAQRTPEPFGGDGVTRPRLFVVQKHAARRMHYDFRLEWAGVLKSWAVPRGPSMDPHDKRLAVHVEDHPVEYADFQGIIPKGNYGAGAVIVWDKGLWIPLEDPEEGLKKGKLYFELKGYKLRGQWHLFRTAKGADNEWLLVKRPDAWAGPGQELPEESIFSGVTVEELGAGADRADSVRRELEELKPVRRKVRATQTSVMLAETAERPFTDPGWIFELKYDGFRLLASRSEGQPHLHYRRGKDATHLFPDLARALRALPFEDAILDGEVVVLDDRGHPSFQALQKRVQLTRTADIERAAVQYPATLFLFDLLSFEGWDLRGLPLVRRKELLAQLLPPAGPLRYCDHIVEKGEAFFEKVRKMDLEGIIAKRADSAYRSGRHDAWLKLRVERTADLVVVGYTEPKGHRSGFGALHLAAYDGGALVYSGRVGTGFTQDQLEATLARLQSMEREEPPCGGTLPSGGEHHWVEPRIVCEVRYLEWTDEGLLRQPVFLRFREDKPPSDCLRPATAMDLAEAPREARAAGTDRRDVPFTNLSKVFWPEEGYTKGDLVEFYRAIAPQLLPLLKDRPVVLTRYPDGIDGKSFFQVDAPSFVPDWLRTQRLWSEDTGKEVNLFLVEDEESLMYLANLGAILLHVWSSRVPHLEKPDWCIIDLDPKEAPFEHVVKVARAIRKLCTELGIPSYVKTSGSTGLHVLLPLAGMLTYEQSRQLGLLLSQVIVAQMPDIATVTRQVRKRGGRVYLDYVQNGHGRLIVAPYSVRPLPGAPVSTPLSWREVNSRLDPKRLTIKTVPDRVARQKRELLTPILDDRPDLLKALGRLSDRYESSRST